MYLYSLELTNVRQFDTRTFRFQPGFNLVVGENGAGKTTILRGLLAVLGTSRQMGGRPRLEDNEIRLRTRLAKIGAVICNSNDEFEEFNFRKEFGEPATRVSYRASRPLILLYSSNEAICSAMKVKSATRIRNSDSDSFRRNEEFLYSSERSLSQGDDRSTGRQFGNSQSVRKFVSKVLSTFSPGMSRFYWRFEPYECSLVLGEGTEKGLPLDAELQKRARAFAMRCFDEAFRQRKRPFDWPDRTKVTLTPESSEHRYGDRNLPYLSEIWDEMKISRAERELLIPYSLEVKLTPRIMIERKIGALSLDQLSDGEQRLFSLFVDIARQLLINNSNDQIGDGKAIVLIDEIDVHLHPKWQRRIVPALEELFKNCQFIATTHSPFVIQSTNRKKIISIDPNSPNLHLDGGNSIEDIAEDIQGVSVPQRSIRAEKLNEAAKEYFTLLELKAANAQDVKPDKLSAAERSYREASEPFASDPAVHALLKILAAGGKSQ